MVMGQYYLRARYYNPVIGRFTQEDTYYGDGLNLYAYCANNPVGYEDPSGHQVCPTQKAVYSKYRKQGMSKKEAYEAMKKEFGIGPKPNERTIGGYVKNNANPKISLHTNSAGFNNNKGNVYGSVGSKTTNGGVTPPSAKDVKQLYEYLKNGKYH